MKENWSFDNVSGGHGKYNSTNKCSSDGEELNNIVTSTVAKVLKTKNIYKGKTKDYYDSEAKYRNLTLRIWTSERISTQSDTIAAVNS